MPQVNKNSELATRKGTVIPTYYSIIIRQPNSEHNEKLSLLAIERGYQCREFETPVH